MRSFAIPRDPSRSFATPRKVAKSSTAAGGLLADLADWLAGWRTWLGGLGGLADLADSDLADWRTRAWRTLGRFWRTPADSGAISSGRFLARVQFSCLARWPRVTTWQARPRHARDTHARDTPATLA
eukprot:gene10390-biopygen3196